MLRLRLIFAAAIVAVLMLGIGTSAHADAACTRLTFGSKLMTICVPMP